MQQSVFVGRDTLERPKAVYPSLTANTKGSWVELTAASTFDSGALTVNVPYVFEGSDYLIDIGIGPAGSEQVLVSNLLVSAGSIGGSTAGVSVRIPLPIASGIRIAARAQATGTSASRFARVGVHLEGNTAPAGGTLTTIGAATADSGGTPVDPGASDNTKGAWAQLTASAASALYGAFFAFGNQANTTRTDCNWLVDIGIGGAGSEQVILADIPVACNSTADSLAPILSALYDISIPEGVRMAARASCTIVDATDRLLDVVMYAVA